MNMQMLDSFETKSVDLVAKVSPWCAPVPTAYLVGRSTVIHLGWPEVIGVIAAVVVETLGLASTATVLELRQYNQTKRKTDPVAPFWLALVLVLIYFVVATMLTIALDIIPPLVVYAPAIFPVMSLTGVTVLALRSDHKRRLQVIADEKAERKAARQGIRKAVHVSDHAKVDTFYRLAHEARQAKKMARMNALVDLFNANPLTGITEAGKTIGTSRQTIYTYLDQLEQEGRIRRNGGGVEVVMKGER